MLKQVSIMLSLLFIGSGFTTDAICDGTYLKGYIGGASTKGGKDNTLVVTGSNNPVLSDHFKDDSGYETGVLTGIAWGMSLPMDDNQFMVGIAYYWQDSVKQEGYIDELNDTQFRNYKYEYRIGSQRLMLEGAWLWPQPDFIPYLSVGMGYARNKWSSYKDHVIDPHTKPVSTPFQSNTESGLAWQIGAGIEYSIDAEWMLDIRYLYVNLGDAKSGGDKSGYYQGKLETNNIQSHQVMLGISYLY